MSIELIKHIPYTPSGLTQQEIADKYQYQPINRNTATGLCSDIANNDNHVYLTLSNDCREPARELLVKVANEYGLAVYEYIDFCIICKEYPSSLVGGRPKIECVISNEANPINVRELWYPYDIRRILAKQSKSFIPIEYSIGGLLYFDEEIVPKYHVKEALLGIGARDEMYANFLTELGYTVERFERHLIVTVPDDESIKEN